MRGWFCLLWVSVAVAQQGADPWIGLRAKNPSGIEVSLRLLREGSYREGELIRAEVHYPGHTAVPSQGPSAELWSPNGFLLDPAGPCGTLASPCFPFFPRGGVVTGRLQPESPLVSLNRYLRPLRPGHYRGAALVRKQVLIGRAPMSSTYGYADPAVYAVSNTIEFDVVTASPAWTSQTLAASVAVLQGPEPNNREAWEARTAAAEQLRFLDTPAAWRAALDLMPVEEYVLLEGLSSSSQPVRVCELMQSSIASPGQAVSSYYLDHLNRICLGELRSHDRQALINQASATLAASVPGKVGEKKAIAFQTLMERVQQAQPLPDWAPGAQERIHQFLRHARRAVAAAVALPVRQHSALAGLDPVARIGPRRLETRRLLRSAARGDRRTCTRSIPRGRRRASSRN